MIIRKANTENIHREDKWCNFACEVGCVDYNGGNFSMLDYTQDELEECADTCSLTGGGSELTSEDIVAELGTFCETHDGWAAKLACWGADQLSSLTLKDLMDMRNMACQIKPEMGICSKGTPPPSGCTDGKALCKRNGITQCSYQADCDKVDDIKPSTNWGMIAAIGGGVVVLGIVAVLVLRKK